jgi:hypothetical protein
MFLNTTMKWALVVYFLVAPNVWMTAEDLKYDGWARMYFDTEEICLQYEVRFNETLSERIKGVCQLDQVDIVK